MKLAFPAFLTSSLLAAAILIGLPDAAQANQEELSKRLIYCKNITSILTRAECYDSVIRDFNLVDMNRVDIGTSGGKWNVTKEKSATTGKINFYAILPSNDYVQNAEGKFKRPSLVLRCINAQISSYVGWDVNLEHPKILMNIRIGTGKTVAEHWYSSADRTAVFIKDVYGFIKKIEDQDSILISAWPENEPFNASFDLHGSASALKPLLEACPAPKP